MHSVHVLKCDRAEVVVVVGGRIGVLQQASNQGYITEKHIDVVNKCYMQRKNRMAELIPEKQ